MNALKAWKIWGHFIGYIVCFAIGGFIAGIPRIVQGFDHETGSMVFVSEILRIPITLLILFYYTKYVVRLNLNAPLLHFKNLNIRLWAVVGIGLPAVTLGIFYVSGNMSIENMNNNLDRAVIIDALLKSLGMSLAAGTLEEVVFRGYLFNLLKARYHLWVAVFAPSLIFTLLHIGGVGSLPNAFQLLVAGLLVSLMLVAIYVYTKSIWNGAIVHFLWNFIILNNLISFEKIEKSAAWIHFDVGNNTLFNGGAFGVEVSIPAMIVYSAVLLVIWKLWRARTT